MGTDLTFNLRVWLESPAGFSLGPGKAELLLRIEELGSLNQAAGSLGMSYRRAWGRIKQAEEQLGRPLVEKHGGNKSGYSLTPFAAELVHAYGRWVEAVESCARRAAGELLPANIKLDPGPDPGLDPGPDPGDDQP
jgi:molybdate transport system regulatory protein